MTNSNTNTNSINECPIFFDKIGANQLLLNPKTSEIEKNIVEELKSEFEKQFGQSAYFFLASSGSAQKSDESIKLVALHRDQILNSAERFNLFFRGDANDHWGLVLPDFHIGGLAVRARAFLKNSNVFQQSWNSLMLKEDSIDGVDHYNFETWIIKNKISFISMVPAQIFDLIQKKIKAPEVIKKVFIGASALNSTLKDQAVQLNWPIIETYGMTETSSMIAIKEEDYFKLLPGVEIKLNNELLAINCNSLFTATIQKKSGQVIMKSRLEDSWFQTEDRAEISLIGSQKSLKILERSTEYIKILGVGVSLNERREQLIDLLLQQGLDPLSYELISLEDERAGYKLILVGEKRTNPIQYKELIEHYNQKARPSEKIYLWVAVEQIPRTELGKLKIEQLRSIVTEELRKKE